MTLLACEAPSTDKGLLESFITRDELAQALGLSVRTVDNWARRRQGPPRFKIGARAYYSANDVRAFIRQQRMAACIGAAP